MTDTPLGSRPRLMGIFAHPDDESFGMAGTLARATMAGHPAAIVCATRGEEGQIADPALATPETLGQVRERELRTACAAVGVADVSFLDYIDGHLAEADEHEAVGRIVYHLRRFRPDVIVTFSPNGGYGHVDHIAIHHYTLAAIVAAADPARYPEQLGASPRPHRVRKVYYNAIPRERLLRMRAEAQTRGQDFIPGGDEATLPVEEMGTPMAEITTFVTLTDTEFEAKRRSMASHATQMPADSPWARATAEELREFMGTEVFQLTPPPLSDRAYATPERDVFAGLE
ncbi:MAG: PIG-L family deacetylase [Ktedonobacterales bacterium]|nr:PIG-L family deacetylase [Ktedonobacterales bacterium]